MLAIDLCWFRALRPAPLGEALPIAIQIGEERGEWVSDRSRP